MKKSFFLIPFPLVALAYISIAFSGLLFYIHRISLLIFVMTVVIALIIITLKLTYKLNVNLQQLVIYKEVLFMRFNLIIISPKEVIIFTKAIMYSRVDAKYGGGGLFDTRNSNWLILIDKNNEEVKYEKYGSSEAIEDLANFISNSLNIDLKRNVIAKDFRKDI